jgi:hypothetical protein
MKRLAFVFLLIPGIAFGASPRTWHKSGTANGTSAAVSVGGSGTEFAPASICIKNTDATNNLIVALNQTAVAADDKEGILLVPSDEKCITFSSQNTVNIMTINVISSAASTTYRINAVSSR